MAELKLEFLMRNKEQISIFFMKSKNYIYSNNNTTIFAKITITIQCWNFNNKIVSSDSPTGIPTLIINAIIFHLEIQIIYDGVPFVSKTLTTVKPV